MKTPHLGHCAADVACRAVRREVSAAPSLTKPCQISATCPTLKASKLHRGLRFLARHSFIKGHQERVQGSATRNATPSIPQNSRDFRLTSILNQLKSNAGFSVLSVLACWATRARLGIWNASPSCQVQEDKIYDEKQRPRISPNRANTCQPPSNRAYLEPNWRCIGMSGREAEFKARQPLNISMETSATRNYCTAWATRALPDVPTCFEDSCTQPSGVEEALRE